MGGSLGEKDRQTSWETLRKAGIQRSIAPVTLTLCVSEIDGGVEEIWAWRETLAPTGAPPPALAVTSGIFIGQMRTQVWSLILCATEPLPYL